MLCVCNKIQLYTTIRARIQHQLNVPEEFVVDDVYGQIKHYPIKRFSDLVLCDQGESVRRLRSIAGRH